MAGQLQRDCCTKKGVSMSNEVMRREIREAVQAGERALGSLQEAKKKLDSAKSWGIVDLLGGGLIASMIKHSQMDDAGRYMEDAKRDLRIFQRELQDVQVPMDLRMEIGSFLTFADFFFDGLVADYMVQKKIAEAKEQVEDAIYRVERLLGDLRGQMG